MAGVMLRIPGKNFHSNPLNKVFLLIGIKEFLAGKVGDFCAFVLHYEVQRKGEWHFQVRNMRPEVLLCLGLFWVEAF